MKMKKFLIISFCIFFCTVVIYTSVLSMEIFHTSHCKDENCSLCQMIAMSINFAKNIGLLIQLIIMLFVFNLLEKYIVKNIFVLKMPTLIDLKVIQIK